jgi:protein involved in polysaccharide export with SLBB domain
VDATVSVMGQVTKPGLISFPLDGRLDLLKAIAKAGGPTELAKSKVVLSRPNQEPITYDLDKVRAGVYGTVWLSPNDEIKVLERWL